MTFTFRKTIDKNTEYIRPRPISNGVKKFPLTLLTLVILLFGGVQMAQDGHLALGVQKAEAAYFKIFKRVAIRGHSLSVNTPPAYIENLFSAYTYTGNGATQTITNGLNLSGKGGLVWARDRTGVSHVLYDTIRGIGNFLMTNLTTAEQTGFTTALAAFNSNGFRLGTDGSNAINVNSTPYVSWSFVKAPKFFKTAIQVHTNGAANTIDLSSLGTVGMVTVKRTDSTSDWYTWHRSLTAGKLVYLNTTAAETADTSISVSGTTLTLSSGLATGTYIIYAWAHDTSANGLIQCGSVTADAGGTFSLSLGWEPQYVLLKWYEGASNWYVYDTSRLWSKTSSWHLHPNTSAAEADYSAYTEGPNATGARFPGWAPANANIIYCAIRRGPMGPPTTGAQVYNAIARTGTGAAANVTGVGFPPDLVLSKLRNLGGSSTLASDRLRGAVATIYPDLTNAESSAFTNMLTAFGMDGITVGSDTTIQAINAGGSGQNYVTWFFRRYPGVFDEVAYTGTGTAHAESHNLGVAPELLIIKARTTTAVPPDWVVRVPALGDVSTLSLNTTAAVYNYQSYAWDNSNPTAASFRVSLDNAPTNSSEGKKYVAYLFASKPGVSKVGSYTGNGSTQNINAKFTATARFVMIKRTDSTGDWFVWDSTRGIIAGNDPHLSWNTTAAEVTTDDSIDPYVSGTSSGFTVNQDAATNINVASATYIYLAFQ